MPLMPLRDHDPRQIGGYRLIARLGAGGMGVVYLGSAFNGSAPDGGQVAIKVLRTELSDDAEFRARFRREVTTIARVSGICTVRVIEADVAADQPYLVTEYAPGPTLLEWAGREGPVGPEMLTGLAAGLAEALAAIHAAGIVHRDLKPGNVLLTADGPKVIDFGIAHTLDATSVTRTGMSIGSPGFMAPEQVRGKSGPPADIFAWGLTVAYAASGQPPFGTGPSDVIFYRVLNDAPDIEAVPESLKPLVSAALAKRPEDRPTARDLLTALALGPDSVPAGTAPAGASPAGAAPGAALRAMLSQTWVVPAGGYPQGIPRYPQATFAPRRRRSPATRHPFLLASAGVAAVFIVSGIALMATGRPSAPTPAAPAITGCGVAPSFYSCPPPLSGSSLSGEYPAPPFVDTGWVEQNGWQPVSSGPGWDGSQNGLNAIIGKKFGSASSGYEAFFFDHAGCVGTDVADGSGSTDMQVSRLAPDEIVVRYYLLNAPINAVDVRFLLENGDLTRLDLIPPAQYRRW